MGETRVDLLRLLEDLRDAYPGSIEETILTEIVANALDSGARRVAAATDPVAQTLTMTDDGKGMSRQTLSRYHDLAVTSKRRGRSIGFAGVGIKLGLLVCDEVVTETRTQRAKRSLATAWRFSSRKRAPWRWVEPPGILGESGTAVRLYVSNPLSRLLEPGFIETAFLSNFEPLFYPEIVEGVLSDHYPHGFLFAVNGRAVGRAAYDPASARLEIKVGRQRKPSGAGFMVQSAGLGEEERGIAISTLGKVIKRGWDWTGIMPAQAEEVAGLIEIPALAEVLTLNKADFIRSGTRGATFLTYRKAVQEAVSMQLEAWGNAANPTPKPKRRQRALERDLHSVLADLSEEYPLLATLVERRPGGQRRLPFSDGPSPRGRTPGTGPELVVTEVEVAAGQADGADGGGAAAGQPTPGLDEGGRVGHASPQGPEHPQADAFGRAQSGLPGRRSKRKPTRYGLHIEFETRPEDPGLGRLVETTVWVNDAHPAYVRALASRSEGYHVALSVAMALAALAVEPTEAQSFVSDFLARWGEAARASGLP